MAINGLNTMYRKPLGMTNDAGLLETYYNKTGQQNPVANTLGRQFKNGPAGTNVANTSPTPLTRTPYGTRGQQGDGSMGSELEFLSPEQRARLGNRYLLGNAYQNNRIIDPNKLEYDEELGWLGTSDNVREDNSGLFRYGPLGNMALGAGFVLGGGALHSALGAGTAGAASPALSTISEITGATGMIPMGEMTGLGTVGATAPLATTAAAGGGAGIPAAMLEGYMPGATAAGASTAASSVPSLIRNFGGLGSGLLQGFLQNRNNSNYQSNINNIAQGADPWGPYRSQFANMLQEAYKNPEGMMEMLRRTPGYQFADTQGRQAIARKDTAGGYFRSSKLDYDLAEFSSGLASKTWDAEIKRIMQMAGVNIDPNNSANMRAGAANTGAQSDQQMWNNILGGVTDPGFLNWLSSFFGT